MPELQADAWMQSLVNEVQTILGRGGDHAAAYEFLGPRLLEEMRRIHHVLEAANQESAIIAIQGALAAMANDNEEAAEARGFVRGVDHVIGAILNRD